MRIYIIIIELYLEERKIDVYEREDLHVYINSARGVRAPFSRGGAQV